MYNFTFTCRDNGGKYQCFTVKAKDKSEAIKKGMEKAKKKAAGDICGNWDCRMQPIF